MAYNISRSGLGKNINRNFLSRGSFFRNIAIVFTGSATGVLIQVVFTPILTRLYGPEIYGLLAIYNVLLTNLMLFCTLSYEEALILTEDDKSFQALTKWIFLQMLIIMGLLITVGAFCGDWLYHKLVGTAMPAWIWLVVPGIAISVLGNVFNTWNIRDKSFKRNAYGNVANGLMGRLTSVGYAYWLEPTVYGQLSGNLSGLFSDVLCKSRKTYWREIKNRCKEIFWLSLQDAWLQAKRFKRYPSYIFASTWMNRFSTQLPLIALGGFFGIEHIGYYTFAMAMLNLPINLVGNSIRPVFYQRAIELHRSDETSFRAFTRASFRHLFYVGLLPLEVLSHFGEPIFAFVFGGQWRPAGAVAASMGLSVFFQLISSPLASIRRIYGKEKAVLIMNVLFFALSCSLFGFLYLKHPDFDQAVRYYGGVIALFYLFNCINILHLAGLNWKMELVKVILAIALIKILFNVVGLLITHEESNEKIILDGLAAVRAFLCIAVDALD